MKKLIFAVCVFLIPVIYFSFIYNIEYQKEFDTPEEMSPESDWFEMQRAYPFDEIPYAERLKSLEYVKNSMSKDKSINSNWTLAGPINIEVITVLAP